MTAPFTITTPECPGTHDDKLHEITSPNYPQNYDSNEDCTWTIRANSGKGIKLQFLDFDTETDHDYLRIYDRSTNIDQIGNQLSGSSLPGTVVSSGSQLHLTWNSDSITQRKGYKIKVGTYG